MRDEVEQEMSLPFCAGHLEILACGLWNLGYPGELGLVKPFEIGL